jgi:hypothetical protein
MVEQRSYKAKVYGSSPYGPIIKNKNYVFVGNHRRWKPPPTTVAVGVASGDHQRWQPLVDWWGERRSAHASPILHEIRSRKALLSVKLVFLPFIRLSFPSVVTSDISSDDNFVKSYQSITVSYF